MGVSLPPDILQIRINTPSRAALSVTENTKPQYEIKK